MSASASLTRFQTAPQAELVAAQDWTFRDPAGQLRLTPEFALRRVHPSAAEETRAFLSRLEVEDMIGRMLTGTTIEINTRIRILPKEGGGVGVSVDKNDSALVPTPEAPVAAPVEDMAGASGPLFSLFPPENASGN